MNYTVVSVVFFYFCVLLLIGWLASRKIKSNEDFLVAGRRLGPFLLAGTLAATEIGGGSSLGVVEKAYGNWGMGAIWYVVTMGITFVILSFFAPKLRSSMVKTIPEYLRKRYGEAPGIISAIIMILPLIGLTGIQIIASGIVLSVMTSLSYTTSVIIISIVVITYSSIGGLWSVTLTDFLQTILIVGGMALVIPFSLYHGGGWHNIAAHIPVSKMSFVSGIGWKTIISLIIMYTASFAVGQEAIQKYFAAKTEKAAIYGSLLAALVFTVFAFIPTLLGVITYSGVQVGIIDGATIAQYGAKYALPTLAIQTMPAILVGLLFSGLIAATMSSAVSDLLGAGSIFSNDIYKIYIKKHASDKHLLRTAQCSMVGIGLLSMCLALLNTESIIAVLMFSFSLRAGGFFFPYILGHYWRKASFSGAMASIILGSVVVVLGRYSLFPTFGFESIYPGLIISFISFFVFTHLFPDKNYRKSSL
ncbi:MAG TPA: sodium:solute symporter family protein [Victivallales bacterium]|nr:sodium:solute symporter family protein [Victivallales bacterium]